MTEAQNTYCGPSTKQLSILVRCPLELPATIYYLRALAFLTKQYGAVILEDRHGLANLLAPLYPEIILVAPDQLLEVDYDTEVELSGFLAAALGDEMPRAYLMPAVEKINYFREITTHFTEIKVGLIVNDLDIITLLRRMPTHRLHLISFFIVSENEFSNEQFRDLGTNCVLSNSAVHNYIDAAALAANMDYIVTDNSAMAHIAGAMGVPVLYVPQQTRLDEHVTFATDYFNTTLILRSLETTDNELLLRISLAMLANNVTIATKSLSPDELLVDQELRSSLCDRTKLYNHGDLLPILELPQPIFRNVTIETTTVCNLNCDYCPNSSIGRPPKFMAEDTFYRIVDSIAAYQPNYAGMISPHFYGEPLLDSRLETFVRYIHLCLPQATIQIYTNGELFTIDRFLSLTDAGVTKFIISQHSPTTPEHIISTLKLINSSYSERAQIQLLDIYHSSMKLNRGGLLVPDAQNVSNMVCCSDYRELFFNVAGAAVLCCNDYLSANTFGTIHENSVEDIWCNTGYLRIRNLLYYTYRPLPICQKCSYL